MNNNEAKVQPVTLDLSNVGELPEFSDRVRATALTKRVTGFSTTPNTRGMEGASFLVSTSNAGARKYTVSVTFTDATNETVESLRCTCAFAKNNPGTARGCSHMAAVLTKLGQEF